MLDTISDNAKLKFTANLYLSPPTERILQTQWRGEGVGASTGAVGKTTSFLKLETVVCRHG